MRRSYRTLLAFVIGLFFSFSLYRGLELATRTHLVAKKYNTTSFAVFAGTDCYNTQVRNPACLNPIPEGSPGQPSMYNKCLDLYTTVWNLLVIVWNVYPHGAIVLWFFVLVFSFKFGEYIVNDL